MKRYMRDQFEYLGKLLKHFFNDHGLPDIANLDSIARDLWSLPQREFQYAATSLIEKLEQQLPEEFIKTLEYLLVTKPWWDTVDMISTGVLGLHFKRYPKVRRKYLAKWRKSDNLWLRRATILFQLDYKQETDFELMCDIIRENLGSDRFFINKAIGWALRQYARIDPQAVRKFVKEMPLHPLSAREAVKGLEKRR
jgi:3-methyladenine DNA glycosylase AlkD